MPKTYEELLGLKKIEVEELHPPVAPKPIVSEISGSDEGGMIGHHAVPQTQSNLPNDAKLTDSKLTIDFNAIAQASEFQRFIYWILTGQTFRGSNKALKMKMRGVQNKIQLVRRLPPELLKELKEKLREIKIE